MAAVLAVRVHQWSARSYLEDQDMWWLSGLFRSVTLLSRPPGAIDDVFVHADYYHTSGAGTLRVDDVRRRRGGRVRIDGLRVGVVAQGPVGGPEAMALHGGDPPGRGIPGPREWRAESHRSGS